MPVTTADRGVRPPRALDDAQSQRPLLRRIAALLLSDEAVSRDVAELLETTGHFPSATGRHERQNRLASFKTRFASSVERILHVALLEAIEHDEEHLKAIRAFFLQPRERYSLDELAALWRVRQQDVLDVFHDRITGWEPAGHPGADTLRIEWADAVGTTITFNLLRPYDIERALGPDLENVRAERWRTVPVLIRIPRFVADAFALDPSIPPGLALAERVEHVLLEFFTTEDPTGDLLDEGVPR